MRNLLSVVFVACLLITLQVKGSPATPDAVAFDAHAQTFYFFSGDALFVKRWKDDVGAPQSIDTVFAGWPAAWAGGIDAAAYVEKEKVFYFFRGDEFVTGPAGGPLGAPRKLGQDWPGWPPEFADGNLEAVVYHPKQKQFYFFRDSRFSRQKPGKQADPAVGMTDALCSIGIFCDGNGFLGWPFRGPVAAATFVEKDKHWYFFGEGTYGIKPYAEAFTEFKQLAGNFPGWPTVEAVAAFSRVKDAPPVELAGPSAASLPAIKLLVQTGHTDTVRHVAFLDANRAVSIGDDGIARIWDIRNAKEIQHLGQYADPEQVFSAVDPGHRWLFLGDTEKITQWDIQSLQAVRTYPVPVGGIQNISVHNNNLVIVFPRQASYANVAIHDLGSDESSTFTVTHQGADRVLGYGDRQVISSTETAVMYADFHPEGRAIVTTGTDGNLRLWRGDSKPARFGMKASGGRQTGMVIADLLGQAIGGTAGEVVTDLGSAMAQGVAHAANLVMFSPDGRRIASTHLNGRVGIWDQQGDSILQWDAHEGQITSASFSPDGARLVTTGSDGRICVWNVEDGSLMRELKGHPGAVTAASFSPDGSMLLSGGDDRAVYLWDADGNISRRFERRAPGVSFVAFHPDGHSFITADRFDPMVRRWNLRDATLTSATRVTDGPNISAMDLSRDGRLLAIGTIDRKVAVFELSSGKQLWTDFHREGDDTRDRLQKSLASLIGAGELMEDELRAKMGVRGLRFSPDGQQVYSVADNSGRVKVWHTADGQELLLSGLRGELGATLAVSEGGRVAISQDVETDSGGSTHGTSMIVAWTLPTNGRGGDMDVLGSGFAGAGNPKRFYRAFVTALEFLPDGLLASAARQELDLWDIDKGERVQSFFGSRGDVTSIAVGPAGRMLATGSTDNVARIWDVASGKVVAEFAGHTARIFDVDLSADGRFLITGSSDGTARLWDIGSRRQLAAFTAIGREDFVVSTTDNYYTASKGATEGLAFASGSRSFPFDQFDLQLNRPDKVIQRIGLASDYVEMAYAQAARKRMRKYGVSDTTALRPDLPVVAVTSVVPLSTAEKVLDVALTAEDQAAGISHLLVSVNDVPLFGETGLALDAPARVVEQSFPVTLSNGRNKIQVSARNAEGYESLRETLEVSYTGPPSKPDLYVIVIGVSEYIDDDIPDLTYAAKDAEDMARQFLAQSRFNQIHQHLLLDGDATRDNIAALKTRLMQTRVDDEVVIFLAGHGLLDDKLDYYFASTDLSLSDVAGTGVSYDVLEGIVDGIPARRKLIMMDTCHAGDADEDERRSVQSDRSGTRSLAMPEVRKVSVVSAKDSPTVVPVVASPREQREVAGVFELMKSLFVNLDRGSGAVVISAAASDQYALESEAWNNGVFTYSVLNGLQDGTADQDGDGVVTATELHRHVTAMVEDLSDGDQVPTTRREQTEFDFRVF